MAIDNLNRVVVLGCGLMGSGIAQVCALAEREVTVIEVSEEYLNKGIGSITRQLGKLTAEDRDKTLGRIRGATRLEDAASAEIVIEAIIESMDEKHKTYSRLDQ